ncbi:hypothetical protein ACSIGC_12205 [Tenacibaculum sp. ZS6-P6]|uniref:hypothetical protein n=1 Tax=Tenacibaculum sp. ZS6-P6 TaxID=3447503 RepID=UPI003F9945AE
MNHNQIDVFSHSRAAAGEALLTNNEIRTGYNLDGFQWGQVAGTIFRKPFLFISSD